MSLADRDQAVPAEAGAAPTHSMPAGLTAAAREAFQDVEEEFREGLSRELRRRRRFRRDLTSDDVYEVRGIVAREMCPSQPLGEDTRPHPMPVIDAGAVNPQRAGSGRAVGAGLMVIGSVGVGSMHPYLHSVGQIAVVVMFGLADLAGVGLIWRSGRHGDVPGESVG